MFGPLPDDDGDADGGGPGAGATFGVGGSGAGSQGPTPAFDSHDVVSKCESAWNKDPVFGMIGIQSGPPGRWVHSGFRGGYGGQVGDAGRGDDREDPSGVFRPEQTY